MRGKMSAGVVMALALLIPAAPAVAAETQAEPTGLDAACKPAERKVFSDIRKLVTIDLDTATDIEVRVLANRILAVAKAESLPVLPGELQKRLDAPEPEAELRAFLKKGMKSAWIAALRISIGRVVTNAGTNVNAAGQKALDSNSIDDWLAYLNEGLYTARALDCAKPTPTPTVTATSIPTATPTATTTTAPAPTSPAASDAPGGGGEGEGGEGGGLPVTGANAGLVAGIGGALLLLGGAGYVIGRRRRSRFVA